MSIIFSKERYRRSFPAGTFTKDFSVAEEMRKATEKSRFPNAAKTIADELVSIAFTHEQ